MPKKMSVCGKHKGPGHPANNCSMPKIRKRSKVESIDWEVDKIRLLNECPTKQRVIETKIELLNW